MEKVATLKSHPSLASVSIMNSKHLDCRRNPAGDRLRKYCQSFKNYLIKTNSITITDF